MILTVSKSEDEVRRFHLDNSEIENKIKSATIILDGDHENPIEITPEGVNKPAKYRGRVLMQS